MKRYLSVFIFLCFLLLMVGGQNKAEGDTKYKVKTGDNLYRIAKKYDLSVQDIKKANNIKGDTLSIGKSLPIPSKNKNNTKSIAHKPKKTGTRVTNKRLKEENETTSEEKIEEEAGSSREVATTERPVVIDKDLTSMIKEEKGKRLFVNLARTLSGVPYRLGGSTMKGIDCSALVKKIYSVFGYDLPRTANLQFKIGNPIEKEELKRGDLVFFNFHGGAGTNKATHVGIFLGNDEILHTSLRNREVTIDKFSTPYFLKNFVGAKRIQEDDFNLKG